MPVVEQRITLVTLGVADVGRARTFYEALGWRGAGPSPDVVFFQAGSMVFALWSRAELARDSGVTDGGGWGGITLAHNVRSPEEVDAVLMNRRARPVRYQSQRDYVVATFASRTMRWTGIIVLLFLAYHLADLT